MSNRNFFLTAGHPLRIESRLRFWSCIRATRRCFFYFLIVYSVILSQAENSGQAQLVVPNASDSQPGNSRVSLFTESNGYLLQTYDASQFSALNQGGFITAVSFRSQEGLTGGFDATFRGFTLLLATFPSPISSPPRVFLTPEVASQLYPDASIVYSGDNVHLSGGGSTSPIVPSPFEVRLQFDRPFFYNPGAGNLLMYLRPGTFSAGLNVEIDAEEGLLSGGYAISSAAILQGQPGSHLALVGQFEYFAVPEPSAGTLVAYGLLAFLLFRYAYRQRSY